MCFKLLLVFLCSFIIVSHTIDSNTINGCGDGGTCTCSPGKPCTIDCNAKQKCKGATLRGGSATSLTIYCTGEQGCQDARIDCGETTSTCSIDCTGLQGCTPLEDLNCGKSVCWMKCGKGDGCADGVSGSFDVSNALSFTCFGSGCHDDFKGEEFTQYPTIDPTKDPTDDRSDYPTKDPIHDPTVDPTTEPTAASTANQSTFPTINPAFPTKNPTIDPTTYQTVLIQLNLPTATLITASSTNSVKPIATLIETITPTDSNIQYVHIKQNTNDIDNTTIIASFISLFFVIVLLCACLIYMKYKQRNRLPITKLKPVPSKEINTKTAMEINTDLENNNNTNEGQSVMIELMNIVRRDIDTGDDGNDTADEMYEGNDNVTRGGNDDHDEYAMNESLDNVQNDINNGLYFAMLSVSPKTSIQQSVNIHTNKKQIHTSPQSLMAAVIPLPAEIHSLSPQNHQHILSNIADAEDEYID